MDKKRRSHRQCVSLDALLLEHRFDFPTQFPGTTVLPLEQNYRSTQPILDATNRVIALTSEGHRKSLWSNRKDDYKPQTVSCLDENEQTDDVIEQILAHRETGVTLKQQAVLLRAPHHSLAQWAQPVRGDVRAHVAVSFRRVCSLFKKADL